MSHVSVPMKAAERGRFFFLRPPVLVVLLCLPALLPMLSVSFWQSHDGLHHIFRIANFDAGIRSGVWFPRWADQLGFGYGFPVTHYYAPLAYYVAELFRLGGAGILDGIKLTYAFGTVASGLGMYLCARTVVHRDAALLASIAYVYYPYHIADMYMRGTLTEFMALAQLPLVVWSAKRIVSASGSQGSIVGSVALFGVLLAALILTHNLTAFLFLPALALYLAVLVVRRSLLPVGEGLGMRADLPLPVGEGLGVRTDSPLPQGEGTGVRESSPLARSVILRLAAGVLLAFGLSAFYWLPAIGETAWIRAGQVSGAVEEMPSLLSPITQFLSFSFRYVYAPDAPAALQHPLGLVVALMSLAAVLLVVAYRARVSAAQGVEFTIWLGIALVIMFAMTDGSAFIWQNVRLLSFVQFPYRLHAILGFVLAMVIGVGADALRTRHAVGKARIVVSAVLCVAALLLIVSSLDPAPLTPQSLPGRKEPITDSQINVVGMSEYDYQTALWARLYGGVWLLEYLPAWVTEAREEFFLPRKTALSPIMTESTPESIVPEAYAPERRALRVSGAEPFRLSFHTFYFPAWQVRVDGAHAPTFPSGALGLVSADIPAGEHFVTLAYEGTTFQHIGEAVSLIAAVFVVWSLLSANFPLPMGQRSGTLVAGPGVRVNFPLPMGVGVRVNSPLPTGEGPRVRANSPLPMGEGPGVRVLARWLFIILAMMAVAFIWRLATTPPQSELRRVSALFNRQMALIGYETSQSAYRAGDIADITLYWFARKTPDEDFKVFIHLDGAKGRAGQVDSQPGLNFSPTTRWQAGELVADRYRLKISPTAPAGVYEIYAGMYRTQPMQNLPVESADASPDNRVRLGTLEVRP